MDLELIDQRLSRVEDDVQRIDQSVDRLRADLADERIASARLAEQVDAHDKRGNERHAEVLAAIRDFREDSRAAAKAADERDARMLRIVLAVVGTLSTAIGGYFGIAGK